MSGDIAFLLTRLPFGLRSAPKIFTALADALEWVLQRHGVTWLAHYLDDYITIGLPNSDVCQKNLEILLSTCSRLGVSTAQEQCAGPGNSLTFFGFELDTKVMVVRLPVEKLHRIHSLVQHWMRRRAGKKRELESLLGHLQHAATVVCPGCTFVRRLIDLISITKNREHWLRLNEAV